MLIENVTLLDSSGRKNVSVEIDDEGIISSIQPSKHASTKLLMPLMVDLNVSSMNESFDIYNLQALGAQALENGIGSVVLRPFAKEPIITTTQLSSIYAYLNGVKSAKVLPAFSVLKDEKHLSDISTLLANEGLVPYIYSDMDSNLMRRVMQYAVMKKVAIFCDLRDSSLNADAMMHEGAVSSQLGLVGNTPLAELVQVSKVLEMAAYFDVEVVIKAISTVAVLDKIAKAKSEGVKVKAEVSLHHLVLDDSSCLAYNTYAKIEPPLRDKKQVEAMQQALKDGKIDILTSLHAPKSKLRKEAAFAHASVGTQGLKNIFSLYYSKLVKSGLIDLDKLFQLTVQTPSLYLPKAHTEYKVGDKVPSMLIDLHSSFHVDEINDLYHGQEVEGLIVKLFS